MKNSILETLEKENNYILTENGAIAHKTTFNAVYDMFGLAGAYRNRSDEDCIFLFKKALEENETLAMKCLFYIRDVRGGQGERRYFRVCMKWLANEHSEIVSRNIKYFAEYGRWDDLYCLFNTPCENDALYLMKRQFEIDMECLSIDPNEGVSLLGKWLKSENIRGKGRGIITKESKRIAKKIRRYFCLSSMQYRKALSALRERINLTERLMSLHKWDEIQYDKIPSKAGLIYRNAFAKHDNERYMNFICNKESKVNASALYPYDIVKGVTSKTSFYCSHDSITETERETLNKYWENQPDYLDGKESKIMCVVDTSGSMNFANKSSVKPIDVAISLGIYCAERIEGAFKNYYISFASRPQLIEVEGVDFVDKVKRIYRTNLCDNTDLKAVFDMLKKSYTNEQVLKEDLPETLVVISDMEIDNMSYWHSNTQIKTEMELLREEWSLAGLKLPKLVYWNVCARNNIILENSETPGVSYVSGCSPILFKSILTGKTGVQLMEEILLSDRYINIG